MGYSRRKCKNMKTKKIQSTNLFGNRLNSVVESRHIRQSDISAKGAVSRPIVNQYLSGHIARPAPKFLRAICQFFEFGPEAEALLICHLKDEISRAGMDREKFTITSSASGKSAPSNIEILERAAAIYPEWADVLKTLSKLCRLDMAEVAEGYPGPAKNTLKVSKPPPGRYDPPKKSSKPKTKK